ncbi:uncharacterized protein LOC116847070 [Odontomachus brunneus]|uniref:uncharacterized protein LOC116847070 n=1 Tax=Odontomachus brunneus TaxID=486640 RepID=UPI0013F20DA8|nr:uncharacterized protein LOC116847070 [Odontomachus brunneus]
MVTAKNTRARVLRANTAPRTRLARKSFPSILDGCSDRPWCLLLFLRESKTSRGKNGSPNLPRFPPGQHLSVRREELRKGIVPDDTRMDRRSCGSRQRNMTTHRRDRMRHSSSWPDRARQTVRVRVDPLSRAFTIIPTSRETAYRSEPTAPRSNCSEEIILLDRCAPGEMASAMMKRRLVDGRPPPASKKAANLAKNSSDANHETECAGNIARYFMPRSLPSTETIHRDNLSQKNAFRDQSRCRSDTLVRNDEARRMQCTRRASVRRSMSDTDVLELLPQDPDAREEAADPVAPLIRRSPPTSAFDVVVKVADQRPKSSIVQTNNNSRGQEANETRRKGQTASVFSSFRHTASPPQIKIVDYDYVTSVSSWSAHHACSKCTSESDLRSQVDPFRSPSQSKKNDATVNARRRDDSSTSSCGRKKETPRSETRAERQGKDTWHEERLISAARKEDGDDKKPTERLADFRKEATLRRHYYPEGGWGYVIVTCSMLVHFLGVGLQLAAPGVWHITAEFKFRHPPLHSAAQL